VLVDIGFILNKVYILGAALREQFLKNLRRSAKAGNGGLFSALISHEKASIPGCII
jgi:hypothetical protein